MKKTIEYLNTKYNTNIYSFMDIYDVCASYYDWDEIAIGMLKKIIFHCNAYIVIHSGWKEFLDLYQLKALFKLYDLDDYIIDVCEQGSKEKVIEKYLNENINNINEYVIIDDEDMTSCFGYHFIKTKNVISSNNYLQIIKILNNEYSFEENENNFIFKKNNECLLNITYELLVIENEKIINFRINNYKDISSEEYNIVIAEFLKNNNDVIAICSISSLKQNYFNCLPIDSYIKYEYKENNYLYYIPLQNNGFKYFDFYNKYKNEIKQKIIE
jgi:hypothetical protein